MAGRVSLTMEMATWFTYGEEVDVEDDKVKSHGENHSEQKPNVLEGWHHGKRLVLRDTKRKENHGNQPQHISINIVTQ